MKKIKFTCPHCEAKLRVPTHLAGVSAPCPKCGEKITAPSDIAAAVADAPAPRRVATRPLHEMSAARASSTTAVMEAPAPPPTAEAPRERRSRTLPAPIPAEPAVALAPTTHAPAPEIPPAFFSPPPPVLHPTPPEPEKTADEREEPPTPFVDDYRVVVEEHVYETPPPLLPPPPAAPITQPIRISPASSGLPPASAVAADAGTLPRLDVSLAGQAGDALPVPEEIAPPAGRTRVFLPRPGDALNATRPEDFLSPVPPQMEEPARSPEIPAPPMPEEDLPTLEDFEDLAEIEVPASASPYTSIPLPPEMAPIPLDELDVDVEDSSFSASVGTVETEPPHEEAFLPEPASDTPPPLDDAEFPAFELPEWDEPAFEPAAPEPSPDAPWLREETTSVPLHGSAPALAPAHEELPDDFPESPLHEGSFGRLFEQQSSGDATFPAATPRTSEVDDLDGLFAATEDEEDESKGISKTSVFMISTIVIVALIAITVMSFLVKNFLGGWTVTESFSESESEQAKSSVALPRVPTSSQTASAPDLTLDDAPAILDPPARSRGAEAKPAAEDAPALSFDEKVQQAVDGTKGGGSIIGSPGLDMLDRPATDFSGAKPSSPAPSTETPEPSARPEADAPAAAAPVAAAAAPLAAVAAKTDANYHPPDSFAAPGPNDTPLARTYDVIDAFLRAPDWETRAKYAYRGDRIRPVIEDYHRKWPFQSFDRYAPELYTAENDASGGPYWVFFISKSDADDNFLLIVRTEGGNLKVDWESFVEFHDQHFLRFRNGTTAPPATFRLIIERLSDYYGSDREAFKDLGDHYVYQVNPPYGELNEFAEHVFVRKDSALAEKLNELVKLGEAPLAVIITLDSKPFAHGVKHLVATDIIEGWFR